MTDSRLPDMDKRENLIIHIEGLQRVLQTRNQTIERLEEERRAMFEGDMNNPKIKKAVKDAYRRGWQECVNTVANEAQTVINALGNLRTRAFQFQQEQEREERASE